MFSCQAPPDAALYAHPVPDADPLASLLRMTSQLSS